MKRLIAVFGLLMLFAVPTHAQTMDTCNYSSMRNRADSFIFAYISTAGNYWPPIDHGTILGVSCSDPGTGNLSRNITYHHAGTNDPDFWQELLANNCYQVGNFVYVESALNWKPASSWQLLGRVRCSCQKRAHAPWDPGSCGWY